MFDHVVIVEPVADVRLLHDEAHPVRDTRQDEHRREGVLQE